MLRLKRKLTKFGKITWQSNGSWQSHTKLNLREPHYYDTGKAVTSHMAPL